MKYHQKINDEHGPSRKKRIEPQPVQHVHQARAPPRSIEERKSQDYLTAKDLPLFGINYSRRHLVRLIETGKFPQPVRLSENRVAFEREKVIAWIEAKKAQPYEKKVSNKREA